jgi:hypothetical protein
MLRGGALQSAQRKLGKASEGMARKRETNVRIFRPDGLIWFWFVLDKIDRSGEWINSGVGPDGWRFEINMGCYNDGIPVVKNVSSFELTKGEQICL